MIMIARPMAVIPAVLLGVVIAGSLSGALALTNDRASVLPAAVDTVRVDEPSCEPACSSHVIASPVPGGAALVVDGASAFGMALEAPTAPTVRIVPATVPAVEPVRVTGGLALADASLSFAE